MAHWILKSEPETYSWSQMMADQTTRWDGVRNYQARNFMKTMAVGDLAFFYHSGKERQIVGVVSVIAPYAPEDDCPNFGYVRVATSYALKQPVGLAALKKHPTLCDIAMIRQSRLSVSPLTAEQFDPILHMAGM